MSEKRYISVDQVASQAMLAIGLPDDSFRNIFREWIYIGQRQIGVYSTINVVEEEKNIKDFKFEIPCNMVRPIWVRIKNGSTCMFPLYKSNGFCGGENSAHQAITIEQFTNHFSISSNALGYDKAEIKYYAIPIGEDGLPLIPEYNELALVAFCDLMYITRQRRREPQKVAMGDVQMAEARWRELKTNVKSYHKLPSELQFSEVARKWNTLLPPMGMIVVNKKNTPSNI